MKCLKEWIHNSPPLSHSIYLQQYSYKLSRFSYFYASECYNAIIAYYLNPKTLAAYIPLVWVDSTLRGRGIASELLAALHQHLNAFGYITISLEVRKYNTAAFRLYTNQGYKITEDRGNKYLMTKQLYGSINPPPPD